MKINKKGTSVVEAIVAMLIIVTGVTGMYRIYISSERLEESTSNKVKALAIAREGIEAMTNIRDTNWELFSSNNKNCWNTINYNINCVSDDTFTYDISSSNHYIIYQDTDYRWKLEDKTSPLYNYTNDIYRTNFRVGVDSNGLYTQTGTTTNLKPLFTREINIKYIEDTNLDGLTNSNDEKMEVTSLVQWLDKSSNTPHKIELKTILTNRKK